MCGRLTVELWCIVGIKNTCTIESPNPLKTMHNAYPKELWIRAAPKNVINRIRNPASREYLLLRITPAANNVPNAFAIQKPAIIQPTIPAGVPNIFTSTIGDTVCTMTLVDLERKVMLKSVWTSRLVGVKLNSCT
jgi:hypothetical protein